MKTNTWTGHGTTRGWFDAANWSGGVPVTGQDVQFTDGQKWQVRLGAAAQSGAITIGGDHVTLFGGTLTAAAAQPAHGYVNDLEIGGNGVVNIANNATLISTTAIQLGATVAGSFGGGSLYVHGELDASVLNIAQGAVVVSGKSGHILLSLGQSIVVGNGALVVKEGGSVDAGPDTLNIFYSDMAIGNGLGAGTLTVSGAQSSFTLGIIYDGNGYDGSINILNGAAMHAGVIYAGQRGDGSITVSGAGSVLTAVNAIEIGDINVLPVGSALTISDGGAVTVGDFGLDLNYGTLNIDGASSLSGTIVSTVGRIDALVSKSAGHVVTLGNAIVLESNNGAQGQFDHTSYVSAEAGGTLNLGGVISGAADAILSAGSGHIVLANGANSYVTTQIYDATLEVAVSGAAGSGTISFTGGAAQAPVLQIDAGVAFTNTIAGFGGRDVIDLRGFAFGGGVTDAFAGGTLTLTDASGRTSLALAGSYTPETFTFRDDHAGGTIITFKHP